MLVRQLMAAERIAIRMSDGVRLCANAAGDLSASLVVLLHGGDQARHSWPFTFGALVGAGCRVLAYDSSGHGESSWSSDELCSFK